MTIQIVGLGPAGAELVTAETLAVLQGANRVIVRTRHHPAVAQLDPAGAWDNCDDLYGSGDSFDGTYRRMAERVVQVGSGAELVYAVPGNPLIAEASVPLVLELARADDVATRVYPALGYPDVAAVALERDLHDVQLCDALALRLDTWRPALVGQVHSRDTAAALKLRLLDFLPADHQVAWLHSLATPEQAIAWMPLSELDHRPWGYLDTLFVPPLDPLADLRRFDGFWHVIERLHAPDGCPWDREQTHLSLRTHLLEEAYELLEAIDADDSERIAEELGDVLLQVAMHSAVGERAGRFGIADVFEQITTKLMRRHPHVFGERANEKSADEVYQDWEVLKQAEKPSESVLDGVPGAMPALAASQAIQGRARRVGFDWPSIEGPLEKLQEEIGEFARAEGAVDREAEFGDILFVVANIGQRLGVDAEQALRGANEKFRRRFRTVEQLAGERGLDLKALDLAGLDSLWDAAKRAEAGDAGPQPTL